MIKKWNVHIDGREMNQLEIIEALLESRGIKDYEHFLTPNENSMVPFDEMTGLETGYHIVFNTIDDGGKFIIHFDVDNDGIAAGTIMTRYLLNFTDNIETRINDGKQHGVEDFDLTTVDEDTTIIVVDSLNNDPAVYQRILNTGAKLLVLDHHLIEERLWDEVWSKNMDQFCLISSANDYPNPALSGAGVVFKFCQYCDEVTWNDYADEFWDLAAAGIVGDMCDISEQSPENRYICYKGFNNQKNLAISKINGTYGFDAKAVSFGISPLINAACRMRENEKAMKLFLSNDIKEVNALIKDLKKCKEKQNEIVSSQMDELIKQGEAQSDKKCMYFFIDADGEIAGLMGNKLLEMYQRPLFVLRKYKDQYAGSMRAIGVDNFAQIVNDTGIGTCMGHELAAGAFIPIDRFDEFKNKIEEVLSSVEFVQYVDVDIQLDPSQVTDTLIQEIKNINKISGTGFPPITVMIGDVSFFEVKNMSNGKHLKIETPDVTFIKWNFSNWEMFDNMDDDFELSGVGQLDSGFFGRTYYRQLILNDFKLESIW